MSDWIDVEAVEDFLPGTHRVITIDDMPVVVFNVGGHYYAVQNLCTHEDAELSEGTLEGEEIVCPLHGARFSVVTGVVLGPPAYENLRTFPVVAANGRVQVDAAAVGEASG